MKKIVHKHKIDLYSGSALNFKVSDKSFCNIIRQNPLSLQEKRQFATYWKNVTCKKCLKHKEK